MFALAEERAGLRQENDLLNYRSDRGEIRVSRGEMRLMLWGADANSLIHQAAAEPAIRMPVWVHAWHKIHTPPWLFPFFFPFFFKAFLRAHQRANNTETTEA